VTEAPKKGRVSGPLQDGRIRCAWSEGDRQMMVYHDTEWGVPEHDGRALFEKLLLDGLQAGLSWRTILHRRAGLQAALDHFNPAAMAAYDEARVARLMVDPRLIRSRLKIQALVKNAQAYRAIEGGDAAFSDLLWRFVGHVPVQHSRRAGTPSPTQSAASVAMSQALRARGFSFCGPVICYAFMQAVGMINDHDSLCFRHKYLAK
jgi:DNA-3-methyladenine glycosylase I